MAEGTASMSIYRASRTIKRRQTSLYNSLRSIHEDSIFVSQIAQLWPELPLVANLLAVSGTRRNFIPIVTSNRRMVIRIICRSIPFASISMSPLSLRGGCMIVDSTRKGKWFPDSMSKTIPIWTEGRVYEVIPIWTCVLNRAILNYRNKTDEDNMPMVGANSSAQHTNVQESSNWDSCLHLPLWVSETESERIESNLDKWVNQLETSGADIAFISSLVEKPLRPLWISQKTIIWLK